MSRTIEQIMRYIDQERLQVPENDKSTIKKKGR